MFYIRHIYSTCVLMHRRHQCESTSVKSVADVSVQLAKKQKYKCGDCQVCHFYKSQIYVVFSGSACLWKIFKVFTHVCIQFCNVLTKQLVVLENVLKQEPQSVLITVEVCCFTATLLLLSYTMAQAHFLKFETLFSKHRCRYSFFFLQKESHLLRCCDCISLLPFSL